MSEQGPRFIGLILTWQCQHCGWANDNNNGPCRKCGATEQPEPPKRPRKPRAGARAAGRGRQGDA
jgi:hypothetical protein